MNFISHYEQFNSICMTNQTDIAHKFIDMGIKQFGEAINYVQKLPYGRNSHRSDYRLVLQETRGTCSTKHALIKTLADELKIPMTLKLGIFLLDCDYMPTLKPILDASDLQCLPEAHCYLEHNGAHVDITHPEREATNTNLNFLQIHNIEPNQIGSFKQKLHQEFVRSWAKQHYPAKCFEDVWLCREQCIEKASEA